MSHNLLLKEICFTKPIMMNVESQLPCQEICIQKASLKQLVDTLKQTGWGTKILLHAVCRKHSA